jgi:hypothetical protein
MLTPKHGAIINQMPRAYCIEVYLGFVPKKKLIRKLEALGKYKGIQIQGVREIVSRADYWVSYTKVWDGLDIANKIKKIFEKQGVNNVLLERQLATDEKERFNYCDD